MKSGNQPSDINKYISPLGVWALSFGCAVGWGAFVMPGTTFLPSAGPLGTVIGMVIGAALMLVIGANYHFLMNRYPDAGGTMTYATKIFGYDHGFLSSWFLILVYVAILWANATALVLIFRNLMGSALQFGFHYQISGYDVYLGEALISVAAIMLVGMICIKGKRLAIGLQILMALILIGGIVVCFVAVMAKHSGTTPLIPAYAPSSAHPLTQMIQIVVLAPWAFVGFESVSHSTKGFRFPVRKTIWIIAAALLTGALSYILLSAISAAIQPEGYSAWTDYIADLNRLDGIQALPTFFAVNAAMGRAGFALLGITVLCGILTGLLGNLIAASRLLFAMSAENIIPKRCGKLNKDHVPQNAILFLILISLPIPFLGRTAIGWIVDVNTIGATIAYAYASASAFKAARRENNLLIQGTGVAGVIISTLFFLYFMLPDLWPVSTMSTESYLILIAWSILGFVVYRTVFHRPESVKLDCLLMLARQTCVTKASNFPKYVFYGKKGRKNPSPQRKIILLIQLRHLCGCES